MNSNYTAHRLSYHSTISLLKVTGTQEGETLRGKSVFPDRREYRQIGERTDEGDKSIGVKLDNYVRASANNDSCTSNIDSKIEHRFKRKFAYLI